MLRWVHFNPAPQPNTGLSDRAKNSYSGNGTDLSGMSGIMVLGTTALILILATTLLIYLLSIESTEDIEVVGSIKYESSYVAVSMTTELGIPFMEMGSIFVSWNLTWDLRACTYYKSITVYNSQ